MHRKYIEDDGTPIELNRGDTDQYPLFINFGDKIRPQRHEVGDCEWLYVAVCQPNEKFEDAILKKAYNKDSEKTLLGDIVVRFDNMDTQYLLPGNYYIEAKLVKYSKEGTMEPQEVTTVIHRKKFTLY